MLLFSLIYQEVNQSRFVGQTSVAKDVLFGEGLKGNSI
jgi:hypothetical protein